MSARDNILLRIRKAQGRSGSQPTEAELATVRAAIARREVGPQPAIARASDPVAQFLRECDRVGTTHSHAETLAEVPREVARYLEANGLERRLVAWPGLAALGWPEAGVAVDDRPAQGSDRVGLTGSFCAVAETGTVLLLGAARTPKATALLPETHVCIVDRARIVSTMEQAFALLRAEVGELPRATWFVSGPSRTADIEQTIVIGAHGPYRTHVVLVGPG
jgi:L-lactate dehydrogenase complex protein LldG